MICCKITDLVFSKLKVFVPAIKANPPYIISGLVVLIVQVLPDIFTILIVYPFLTGGSVIVRPVVAVVKTSVKLVFGNGKSVAKV